MLAVTNYYTIESFNRSADQGLVRTNAWQGTLVYLSFLGDYMFEQKNISGKYMERLLRFVSKTSRKDELDVTDREATKKLCNSCAMILHTQNDYPRGDTTSACCRHCTDEDGNLKPLHDVSDTMTDFFERTQIPNTTAARRAALAVLAKNPAWNRNFEMRKYTLKIYDASARLAKDFLLLTTYYLLPTAVSWHITDQANRQLGGGVYICRLEAGDYRQNIRMILLR